MNSISWVAAAGCLALSACGAAGSREQGSTFPGDDVRRRTASPVTQVWVSPADAELSSFNHLAVDSRGNAYVPDFYRNRVVVFGPDGRVLRAMGRRGRGPGEFQSVRTVQVFRGDSLLVYDSGLGRINVYPPHSDREAYVVNLRGATPWALERTHANDAFVARFEPAMQFGYGDETSARLDRVRVLNLDGSPRTDVLSFPARSFVVAQQSMMPNPWGHNGFVRLDSRDRLHYVWSDTLGTSTYDLQGQRVAAFRVQYAPPPVTRADLEREVGTTQGPMRAALEDSLPSRWPAVGGLLVDDRDRVWLELAGPRDRQVEWAAFSPAGAYLGSMLVPAGTSVYHISRSGALGKKEDEEGAARLVLYRIVRPPR